MKALNDKIKQLHVGVADQINLKHEKDMQCLTGKQKEAD